MRKDYNKNGLPHIFFTFFLCSVREPPDLWLLYRFECDQFSLYSKARKMMRKGVDSKNRSANHTQKNCKPFYWNPFIISLVRETSFFSLYKSSFYFECHATMLMGCFGYWKIQSGTLLYWPFIWSNWPRCKGQFSPKFWQQTSPISMGLNWPQKQYRSGLTLFGIILGAKLGLFIYSVI